jgi:hypothetical protein
LSFGVEQETLYCRPIQPTRIIIVVIFYFFRYYYRSPMHSTNSSTWTGGDCPADYTWRDRARYRAVCANPHTVLAALAHSVDAVDHETAVSSSSSSSSSGVVVHKIHAVAQSSPVLPFLLSPLNSSTALPAFTTATGGGDAAATPSFCAPTTMQLQLRLRFRPAPVLDWRRRRY